MCPIDSVDREMVDVRLAINTVERLLKANCTK